MNRAVLVIIFSVCAFSGFSQLKSGLIISGGSGSLNNMKLSSEITNKSEMPFWLSKDYKFNLTVGYKFRIQPQSKHFFYDINLNLGIKQVRFEYSNFYYQYQESDTWEDREPETQIYGKSIEESYYYFSINPSWNYSIIKGLHAGAGIEPTLYAINFDQFKFDTPVTAQIGYDFRFVDIALTYKMGLLNTMNPDYLSSGRFNDWQIQVFIPF